MLPPQPQRCTRVDGALHDHAEAWWRSVCQYSTRKQERSKLLFRVHTPGLLVFRAQFLLDIHGVNAELAGGQRRVQEP